MQNDNSLSKNLSKQQCRATAYLTHEKFNISFKTKYKKSYEQQNLYTVICSIGFINKQTKEIQIVALASGTKSLPYSLYQQHRKCLLKDMHAEILAIKAFRKYIIKQQLQNPNSKHLIQCQKTGKKSIDVHNYLLFMYSSEPFCGDCSIDQEKGHFSGGKPLKYYDCKQLPNDKFEKHILRTKPGRIDLPESKRSLSLSCSDKIALYNILGIQGKQLFQFIRPIYIDIFIINAPSEKQESISNGINFIRRISQLRSQKQSLIKRRIFNIIVEGKQRKISGQFKQNSPQIICIGTDQGNQNKNHFSKPETSNFQKKVLKQGLEVSLIHTKSGEQWINGKTGLPEGCSLNNYMKKGKISTFSKKIFLQDIEGLRQFSQHNQRKKQECSEANQIETKISDSFKYSAIKDRIKLLFGIWTDNFKQTKNRGHSSDGKQRQQNK